MDVAEIKQRIRPILEKYHIKKAGIFGSHARESESHQNDLDLLVELQDDVSLLDFVGIKLALEDELKMKVDLVEYKAIKPDLKDRILNEEIPVL